MSRYQGVVSEIRYLTSGAFKLSCGWVGGLALCICVNGYVKGGEEGVGIISMYVLSYPLSE